MDYRLCTETDKQQWNNFVDNSPYGDILQRWEWGEVKKGEGWTPYRLGVFAGDDFAVAAQVQVKRAAFFGSYLYVSHGPIFQTYEQLQAGMPALLQGLRELATELNAFVIEIEPKAGTAPEPERITPTLQHFVDTRIVESFLSQGFRRIRRTMQAPLTLLYDLTQTEEGILGQMKKNTRYNVGLANRRGVEIKTYYPDDQQMPEKLQKFYESLQAVNARSGFPIRPFSSFQAFMDQFKGTQQLALFEASLNGESIAFNISEFIGFWSSSFYAGSFRVHTDTKAAYLMRWEAVKMAKARGCQIYDFWGIFPNDPAQKGYTDVKLSFGGVPINYVGLLALPLSPIKYALWEQARAWRIRFYKLISKLKGA